MKYLKRNRVIGLPTETVYGLAGNAYSSQAIKKIYKLKGRPRINPLIIHYYDLSRIQEDVVIKDDFLKLYKAFCPGPLTFILKERKVLKFINWHVQIYQPLVLDFQSIELQKILKKLNFPLAMPSANKSNAVSPVTSFDVAEEFKKKSN